MRQDARQFYFKVILLCCVFCVMCLWNVSIAHAQNLQGIVIAIADGDTITVLDKTMQQHRIRLEGIDAPEKKQPYGQAAKQYLSDLLFQKEVRIQTDKTDRYGRMVGKVWLHNQDVNLALLRAGLAWNFKKYAAEQSPEDQARYAEAEQLARLRKIGLWQDPQPIAPWEWRDRLRQR